LVFWVWSVAVWVIARSDWVAFTSAIGQWLEDAGAAQLLVVAIGAVLVVLLSSVVIGQFTLPLLRALEGYWTDWLSPIHRRRVAAWVKKLDALEAQRARPGVDAATVSSVEVRLRRFPDRTDVMPTRIGNIVRAGERRPAYWYGLDAVVVWPQLWLALPEHPRTGIAQARAQLDHSVTCLAWAILSIGLGVLWWPATLVGVVTAWLIGRFWVPVTAENYATLISAVFDTHRFSLYAAMDYPRPVTPDQERAAGRALTSFLWNGASRPSEWGSTTDDGDPP
jgi:hypothetical protein